MKLFFQTISVIIFLPSEEKERKWKGEGNDGDNQAGRKRVTGKQKL